MGLVWISNGRKRLGANDPDFEWDLKSGNAIILKFGLKVRILNGWI